eukprot:7255710-Prymnesium_polylepis.1
MYGGFLATFCSLIVLRGEHLESAVCICQHTTVRVTADTAQYGTPVSPGLYTKTSASCTLSISRDATSSPKSTLSTSVPPPRRSRRGPALRVGLLTLSRGK